MGVPVNYPDKLSLQATINKFVPNEKGRTSVSGYWLNNLLSAILKGTPWIISLPSKYTAILQQVGIDNAPIIVPNQDTSPGLPLINDFEDGDITFVYTGVGAYEMRSASGAFGDEANKVKAKGKTKKNREGHMEMLYRSSTVIEIKTWNFSGAAVLANDLLVDAIIEVEVYS